MSQNTKCLSVCTSQSLQASVSQRAGCATGTSTARTAQMKSPASPLCASHPSTLVPMTPPRASRPIRSATAKWTVRIARMKEPSVVLFVLSLHVIFFFFMACFVVLEDATSDTAIYKCVVTGPDHTVENLIPLNPPQYIGMLLRQPPFFLEGFPPHQRLGADRAHSRRSSLSQRCLKGLRSGLCAAQSGFFPLSFIKKISLWTFERYIHPTNYSEMLIRVQVAVRLSKKALHDLLPHTWELDIIGK